MITIYHNPKCGTSRKVLAMIRDAGQEPEVIEYLKTGWTRETLNKILKKMGAKPHDILRRKEPLAAELGLAKADGEALIAAMIAHPVLVERPIVVTAKAAKLCRPAEEVLALIGR